MEIRIRQFVAAVGLLLAGSAAALGQDAPRADAAPRWKFKPGEVIHYVMTQETTSDSRAEQGEGTTTTMSQTVNLRWTVDAVSPDGAAKLTQTIDRVRAKIASGGQPAPFSFDSAGAPLSKEAGADPFVARVVPTLKALAGSELRFTMTARGEVEDATISDKLREAIRKANPALGDAGLSSKGLKNLLAQATLVLPRDGEARKSWTVENRLPMPPAGTLVVKNTFLDEGPEAPGSSIHKIVSRTETSHESAGESAVDMKISDQKGTGLHRFDVAAGRVVSARIEDSMTTTLSQGGLRLQQATTSKTTTELAKPSPADSATK